MGKYINDNFFKYTHEDFFKLVLLFVSILMLTVLPTNKIFRYSTLFEYNEQMDIDAKYLLTKKPIKIEHNVLLLEGESVLDCEFLKTRRIDSISYNSQGFRPSISTMFDIQSFCSDFQEEYNKGKRYH